jgi:hypothetical protein
MAVFLVTDEASAAAAALPVVVRGVVPAGDPIVKLLKGMFINRLYDSS